MSFLFENIAPITVALAASVVTWLFGGARGDLLLPVVPWLLVIMIEVLLCFPQRHRGEPIYAARSRVWHSFGWSGVFWTAVVFVALLLIPFFNVQGVNSRPPIAFLPSCVCRADHLTTVLWFVFVLTSVLVIRHALTHDGRRLVLSLIVWNGALLALLGFVQGMTGAAGPLWVPLSDRATARSVGVFFSVFGYPNMAGDYFTLLFGVAIALWRARSEKIRSEEAKLDPSELAAVTTHRFEKLIQKHYYLIPAGLFFFSALYTLSRAAIILVSATACVYFFHTLAIRVRPFKRSRRVFIGVWCAIAFFLICFFASIFMPKDVRREVDSLDSYSMLDRVTGKGQYHVQVATEIWRDHLLFGCGGWGYAHLCEPKMRQLKIPAKQIQRVGGANVHNDYLQFLAEHGLVGCGCLLAIVLMLLYPVVRDAHEMLKAYRFQTIKKKLPRPIQIFILPAPVFILLVACSATLIHAFGDCPLRALSILNLLFVVLTTLPAFMPVRIHHHTPSANR